MNGKGRNLSIGRLIITLFVLAIIVVGGTYAWLSYQSNKSALVLSIGDINDSKVILKPYQVKETMVPVNTYTSGVYSTVEAINNGNRSISLKLFYKVNQLDDSLKNNGLKYTIASSTSENGEYTEVKTGNFTNIDNQETTILETKMDGKSTTYYRVYLWLDSSVGNQTALQNTKLDVELNGVMQQEATTPEVMEGMIPVAIENDGTVTTISKDNTDWYDYGKQRWANAILVTESSRSNYLNKNNVEVNSDDILAYYVWIPRYRYKIWEIGASTKGKEQTINIVFEDKDTPKSTGTTIGTYRTHPAFTFGGLELNGIWVGKFETTGDATTPTVLPNKASLRDQNVSTQFTTSLKFSGGKLSNGNVTFTGNNTYGLTANTDSHMMKNSEWGAVAYLTHSDYGINKEVRINNYNNNGPLTGCGAATENEAESTTCGIIYGQSASYPQSTTGNITGVYDISGGAYEYMMGVLADSSGNPRSGYSVDCNSGFNGALSSGTNTSGITFPSNKYYDLYTSTTSTTACNGGACFGHALSETAGWYGDLDNFIFSDGPWFYRGGIYYDGAYAGTFYSYGINGCSNVYDGSFRSVLVPTYQYNVKFDANGGTLIGNTYTTSGNYTLTVPYSGEYKLEVWGAQGGSVDSTYHGGYGGYATGTVLLEEGQNIYIEVGGQGIGATSPGQSLNGGYNGGGNVTGVDGINHITGSGGGATHIATTSGLLSTLSDSRDSILIVAGGGGGGRDQANHVPAARWGVGGSGGGYIAGGALSNNGGTDLQTITSVSGTQTSGYAFGQGEPVTGNSAGGGGWYGGYSGSGSGSGGGGSGYIGNSLLTDKHMYCYNCETSADANTKTYSTTNVSSTPTSDYAKSGDGAVKITYPSEKSITYGDAYGNLPTPTRTGYTFLGWYTEPNGGGVKITSDTASNIASNHTLYAHWQVNTYQVTYDYNYLPNDVFESSYNTQVFSACCGTGSLTSTDISYTNEGKTYAVTSTNQTWFFASKVAQPLTVGEIYTFSFEAKASENLSATIGSEQGGAPSFDITTSWKRYTYTFTAKNTGDFSAFIFYYWQADHSRTLYIRNMQMRIGNLNTTTVTKEYGENYGDVSIPTRQGYTFLGWYTEPIGGTKVENTSSVSANNHTLYAHWQPMTITVIFNKNDGSGETASQTFTYGQLGNQFGYNTDGTAKWGTSGQFGAWNRVGYTLKGWSHGPNDSAAGYPIYCGVSDEWIAANYPSINLYGVWEANTYTVTTNYYYLYQNTTWTHFDTRTDTVTYGSSFMPYNVAAPAGYYAGNNYNYYDGSANYLGSGIVGTESFTVTQNHIVNVHYYPYTYAITYNANGGWGQPGNQTKIYATPLTLSGVVPARTGYTFLGWSTDPGATSPTYAAGGTYTANAGATLYAVWRTSSLVESYSCANGSVGSSPAFTYTGNCQAINDGNGNWRVKFLTSGTFKPSASLSIDVFLVGGGGGGGNGFTWHNRWGDLNMGGGGGGGGGGYAQTATSISISSGTSYTITIGAGGAATQAGGSTTAFGVTAAGGNAGSIGKADKDYPNGGGGAGGTGGNNGGKGGGDTDEGPAVAGSSCSTTTREFGISSATCYAGGGGGGANYNGWVGNGTVGAAGSGGGGNGGSGNGTVNTGGGGGGGTASSSKGTITGGSGGSGIVIIRNKR